jgi:hypothetical protein
VTSRFGNDRFAVTSKQASDLSTLWQVAAYLVRLPLLKSTH